MADNLYGFICVHFRWISLRLLKDLSSAVAIRVFSDKHKSQYRIPFIDFMNPFKEPDMEKDYEKPEEEIPDQIGHQQTSKRGNLDATASELSEDYEKPEKIVCKLEPHNVCYRINPRKREIVPTGHVIK